MNKFLMRDDLPRWYDLFWDFKKNGLFLRIHRLYIAHTPHKNCEPYFDGLEERLDFQPLFERCESRLGQDRFGISDSIVLTDQDENWLTYRVKLPYIVRRGEYIYVEINKVCFSLAVLLNFISMPIEVEFPHAEKQLFTVTTCCERGSHGHSLGGYASPTFVRHLERFSTSSESPASLSQGIDAMKIAHKAIFGKVKDYHKRDFQSFIQQGQFILSCPGDACDISTEIRDGREIGDGYGTTIICHNLDSPHQQLTLLAGLGALSSVFNSIDTKSS